LAGILRAAGASGDRGGGGRWWRGCWRNVGLVRPRRALPRPAARRRDSASWRGRYRIDLNRIQIDLRRLQIELRRCRIELRSLQIELRLHLPSDRTLDAEAASRPPGRLLRVHAGRSTLEAARHGTRPRLPRRAPSPRRAPEGKRHAGRPPRPRRAHGARRRASGTTPPTAAAEGVRRGGRPRLPRRARGRWPPDAPFPHPFRRWRQGAGEGRG